MKSDKHRLVAQQELSLLREMIPDERKLNLDAVSKLGWIWAELDDPNIFGRDAENVAAAMHALGVLEFYVLRTFDLVRSAENSALVLSASAASIELFQNISMYEISLDDCVFFSVPLSFLL